MAAIAPAARLMPKTPFQAAQLRGVIYYLASTMHMGHAHKMRAWRWADTAAAQEDLRAKLPETMDECCACIE
jgi:glutathione S-transferase